MNRLKTVTEIVLKFYIDSSWLNIDEAIQQEDNIDEDIINIEKIDGWIGEMSIMLSEHRVPLS